MVSRELRNKTILWSILAVGVFVIVWLVVNFVHFGVYSFWVLLILAVVVLIPSFKGIQYAGRYIDELAKENRAKRKGD